jgi:GNAT superfamily N-acetyltransferase
MRMHVGTIPADLAAPLDLRTFPEFHGAGLCFVSKLMVRKEHRSSTVAGRLVRAAYLIARRSGIQAAFCTTFPHLVPLYERVGFRSYLPMYIDAELGPHFALVFLMDDVAHLEKTRSILRDVLDDSSKPKSHAGHEICWYR